MKMKSSPTDTTGRGATSRPSRKATRARGGRRAANGSGDSKFTLKRVHFELLYLLADERTVRLDLASALLGIDPLEGRSLVAESVAAGLLGKEAILRDEPAKYPWIWATRLGLRAAGVPPHLYHAPTEVGLKHLRGVHKIRLHCERQYPDWEWVSERGLSVRHNRTQRHLADAALERDGQLIPIEYERTQKDRIKVVRNMCELLDRHGEAHFYCSPQVRPFVEGIKEANNLGSVHIFDVPEFPGIA
jgi:hypothetical protein